jgi:hypothetical protein
MRPQPIKAKKAATKQTCKFNSLLLIPLDCFLCK